jgi:lipid-binding SYLF domain-containing protein
VKKAYLSLILSLGAALALSLTGCATSPDPELSQSSAAQLDAAATSALQNLYASSPAAKDLSLKAKAVLVFPDILKGGFVFGGEIGNGVLRQGGRTTGYYNIAAASYGLQAGAQSFGYALFLMNDSAMASLRNTGGWEIGVGPSIVVVDQGMARSLTTTTLLGDVYAFIFDQKVLMAGAGLQGSKITRIGQ